MYKVLSPSSRRSRRSLSLDSCVPSFALNKYGHRKPYVDDLPKLSASSTIILYVFKQIKYNLDKQIKYMQFKLNELYTHRFQKWRVPMPNQENEPEIAIRSASSKGGFHGSGFQRYFSGISNTNEVLWSTTLTSLLKS